MRILQVILLLSFVLKAYQQQTFLQPCEVNSKGEIHCNVNTFQDLNQSFNSCGVIGTQNYRRITNHRACSVRSAIAYCFHKGSELVGSTPNVKCNIHLDSGRYYVKPAELGAINIVQSNITNKSFTLNLIGYSSASTIIDIDESA